MTLRERARLGEPLDELRIVDIHGHGGPYAEFVVYDGGPEGIVRTMDASGIETLFVAPHVGMGPDEEEANRLAVEWSAQTEGRLRPYCVVNPNRSARQIRSQLEQCIASGRAAGLKFHPSLHRGAIGGEGYQVALEYAARFRVPVLVHTWEGCPYCDPRALGEAARRYPEAKFLMGHTGGFPQAYTVAAEAALEATNVWFDLTGSRSRAGCIEKLVALVGSERVVFGSDLPFLDPRPKLGQVLFADLSDEVKRAILGGNARGIFGLPAIGEVDPQ